MGYSPFKTALFGRKEEVNFSNIPCTHEWGLVARTYGPPRPILPNDLSNIPPEIIQKAMFGVTTYFFECAHCKERKMEEMLGSDISELDTLIQKAESTGEMQYVNHNGMTYAMAKVPPNMVPPNATPVR